MQGETHDVSPAPTGRRGASRPVLTSTGSGCDSLTVTPYPQPGPPPPRPPVQGDRSIVLLVVLMALGGLLLLASLVGWGVYLGYAKTRAAAADPATAPVAHERGKVALPPAQRRVPHH